MTTVLENATVYLEREFARLLNLGGHVAGLCFNATSDDQSVPVGLEELSFLNEAIDTCKEKRVNGLVLLAENGVFPDTSPELTQELACSGSREKIEQFVQNVQQTMLAFKYAAFPVVVAVEKEAVGLGCTLALNCDKICTRTDTNLGYADLKRGTIPIGGGAIQLMMKFAATATVGGPFAYARQVFETLFDIGVARNAKEASDAGYLTRSDAVAGPGDDLLDLATTATLQIFHNGYHPPPSHRLDLPGAGGSLAMALELDARAQRGELAADRLELGKRLAQFLCGEKRRIPDGQTEDELLALECRIFCEFLLGKETGGQEPVATDKPS